MRASVSQYDGVHISTQLPGPVTVVAQPLYMAWHESDVALHGEKDAQSLRLAMARGDLRKEPACPGARNAGMSHQRIPHNRCRHGLQLAQSRAGHGHERHQGPGTGLTEIWTHGTPLRLCADC